jgi:hypothetical protein
MLCYPILLYKLLLHRHYYPQPMRIVLSNCQADDRNPGLPLTILIICNSIEYAHHYYFHASSVFLLEILRDFHC